jgi:ribosomal protein S18 acetylase RimI-like enzyme
VIHLPACFTATPSAPIPATVPPLTFVPMESNHIYNVTVIERETRSRPWKESKIRTIPYRERHHADVAIADGRKVIGYLMHEADGGMIKVHNFAVDRDHLRRGVASKMVGGLVERATRGGRNLIEARVPVTMLPACLLLKGLGFRVEMPGGVLPGTSDAPEPGDVYVFRKRLDGGECWGR